MLDFLIGLFDNPPILIGLFAMLGLILQKKPIEDIVRGTLKTTIGFLILNAGAAYLQTASLNAFGELFNWTFNMTGTIPSSEAIVSIALQEMGRDTPYVMLFGMILNIVLARFSPMHFVFLTGHHTLFMACMLSVLIHHFAGLSGFPLWIAGGCLLAFISAFSPFFLEPTMKKIVQTDDLGFGHFGGFGYWVSAQCGKLFKGSKSTEEINFPKRLNFLSDGTVSVSLTMFVFFMIVVGVGVSKGLLSITTEEEAIAQGLGSCLSLFNIGTETHVHWIVWVIQSALAFAAGVFIILEGVNLIVGEIVPAFKGISTKLVPGAIPAIDCPVVFPYAPNAVLIGFLVSFLAGVVGMFILIFLSHQGIKLGSESIAVILPGVVPHFFCGGTAGVFGNAEGGLKGCVVGAFMHGILITFLPALCMPFFSWLSKGSTFSDADFSMMTLVFGNLMKLVQGIPFMVLCVGIYCVPFLFQLAPKRTK